MSFDLKSKSRRRSRRLSSKPKEIKPQRRKLSTSQVVEGNKKRQKITQLAGFIKSFTRSPTPETVGESEINHNVAISDEWTEKYEPHDLSSVAIHSRKLSDVEHQIVSMLRHDSKIRLLVLSGPSGSSKSTVVKRLAENLIPYNPNSHNTSKPLIEWINTIEIYTHQFEDFLGTVKYRTGKNLSIILVEDIPNVFHEETRERFQSAIMQWIHSDIDLPPLILSITECDFPHDQGYSLGYNLETSYSAETILGRAILNSPSCHRIKFNPVNTLLIKKTLKRIVIKEESIFTQIPKSLIEDKIKELMIIGDIRAAISAFQFWAQWKSNDTHEVLSIGKESSLSLFHAIGKCIFGSKTDGHQVTINKVMQDFENRSELLKLGLLENYSKFNKGNLDIKTFSKISEDYSFSNILPNNPISLECAIWSTRVHFDQSGKRSSSELGLSFPREWKVNKSIKTTREHVYRYIEVEMKKRGALRNLTDSNLYHGFYEPLINKQKAFKNKAKLHFLRTQKKEIPLDIYEPSQPYLQSRLGGPFKEIHSDDTIFADGDDTPSFQNSNDEYFQTQTDKQDDIQSGVDSEFDNDPIVESEDEIRDDTFGEDDTFENELIQLSQPTKKTINAKNLEFFDDFNDDDDFSE